MHVCMFEIRFEIGLNSIYEHAYHFTASCSFAVCVLSPLSQDDRANGFDLSSCVMNTNLKAISAAIRQSLVY